MDDPKLWKNCLWSDLLQHWHLAGYRMVYYESLIRFHNFIMANAKWWTSINGKIFIKTGI